MNGDNGGLQEARELMQMHSTVATIGSDRFGDRSRHLNNHDGGTLGNFAKGMFKQSTGREYGVMPFDDDILDYMNGSYSDTKVEKNINGENVQIGFDESGNKETAYKVAHQYRNAPLEMSEIMMLPAIIRNSTFDHTTVYEKDDFHRLKKSGLAKYMKKMHYFKTTNSKDKEIVLIVGETGRKEFFLYSVGYDKKK